MQKEIIGRDEYLFEIREIRTIGILRDVEGVKLDLCPSCQEFLKNWIHDDTSIEEASSKPSYDHIAFDPFEGLHKEPDGSVEKLCDNCDHRFKVLTDEPCDSCDKHSNWEYGKNP